MEDEAALLTRLPEQFRPLRDSETRMLTHLQEDDLIDFEDAPSRLTHEITIRAEILTWLCRDPVASKCVSARGIRLSGAVIAGRLALDSCRAVFPLVLNRCQIPKGIGLVDAEFTSIDLRGSVTGPINAQHLKLAGPLRLSDGFICAGELYLHSAVIGGVAEFAGANITNEYAQAFNANGSVFNNGLFLNAGFSALGSVQLVGTAIKGDLDCENSNFSASGAEALVGDGLRIDGRFFLRNARAFGEVLIRGADISGEMDCNGSRFVNDRGFSLSMANSHIKGSFYMGSGFLAEGVVDLSSTIIGGNLVSKRGASIRNRFGEALNAWNLKVEGQVDLSDVQIHGRVQFITANITGNFSCEGCAFDAGPDYSMTLYAARVGGSFAFCRGSISSSGLDLNNAQVGRNLDFRGSTLYDGRNGQLALLATKMSVGNDALLSGGLRVFGEIVLTGAQVVGTLELRESVIRSIILDGVRSGKLADDLNVWRSMDIVLDGFVYDGFAKGAPTTAQARLNWLSRQPAGQFSPQPYEQLVEVFRRMGREDDARSVAIAKQRALRRLGGLPFYSRLWSLFVDVAVGYGYRSHRAIIALTALIIVGQLVFAKAREKAVLCPTHQAVRSRSESADLPTCDAPRGYPRFQSLLYSAELLLPVVDFGQKKNWEIQDDAISGQGFRVFQWIYVLMGWSLSLLIALSPTRLLRKD